MKQNQSTVKQENIAYLIKRLQEGIELDSDNTIVTMINGLMKELGGTPEQFFRLGELIKLIKG